MSKKVAVTRELLESIVALTKVTKPILGGYQNTVLINLQTQRAVATNGAAMAQHDLALQDVDNIREIVPEEFRVKMDGRIVLNALDCKELKNLLKNKKEALFYAEFKDCNPHGAIIFGTQGGLTVACYLSNYYPNYEQVLPSESKAVQTFALDFNILKDLFDAMEKHGAAKKSGVITFKFISENAPIIVKHGSNGMGTVNVIMPVKMA